MQSESLLNNHATIEILQRLFFSESKPSRLKPIDIAILSYLVLRRCEDHEIFDSYLTIAGRVCSDRQTVARSLERLEKLKWITVGSRGDGRSKAISINIETLPAAQSIRDKITPEAKRLAALYMTALQKKGRGRFPKNWLARQNPSAQRILTHCNGDLELARKVIGHALEHPSFRKRAKSSLYNLLAIWPKVICWYEQKQLQNNQKQKGE